MAPKILTIHVEPPHFEMARVKTVTSTRFVEIWPQDRAISKWYFLTDKEERVYLKVGWNLFGRRSSNNIRIKERNMKSCELTIFVAPEDEESPTVHNINNNCIMDGVRMSKEPETLHHRAAVGIYVRRTRRLVVLEFFNADVKPKVEQQMDTQETNE